MQKNKIRFQPFDNRDDLKAVKELSKTLRASREQNRYRELLGYLYTSFGNKLSECYCISDPAASNQAFSDVCIAYLQFCGTVSKFENHPAKVSRYFIYDENLIKWLEKTDVKLENFFSYMSAEQKSGNEEKPAVMNIIDEFYIHTPSIAIRCAFIELYKDDIVFFFRSNEDDNYCLFKEVIDEKKYSKGQERQLTDLVKFVLNFFFYIKAFPASLHNDLPKNIEVNNRNYFTGGGNHTVSLEEKLKKYSAGTKGFHIRQGFFRYYADDRYVNVKGTWQFIESTIVNGRLKVVEDVKGKEEKMR